MFGPKWPYRPRTLLRTIEGTRAGGKWRAVSPNSLSEVRDAPQRVARFDRSVILNDRKAWQSLTSSLPGQGASSRR